MIPFISSFILYLATLFPGTAPYRDSGEMASVAARLGIAHPPGYPLYTLIARVWSTIMPAGSIGFRLNVLSALAGAGTIWMVFRFARAYAGDGKRAGLTLLPLVLATAYLPWYLSVVSEMYTLNTLVAAALIYLACVPAGRPVTRLYFIAFLFGAGLGVRMDIVLLAPLIAAAVWTNRGELHARQYVAAVLFFLAGISVFLYLPLRSHVVPLLDWNHPATPERLWATIARKTHGGTLDLVAAPFAPGANFAAGMRFYLRHLAEGYAWIGIPLALFGFYRWWRTQPAYAAGTALSWCLAGPLFIYKANMPPNPHALAILEAHFLLPNLIVFVWAVIGCVELNRRFVVPYGTPVLLLSAVMVGFNLHANLPELCKRTNFIAFDYATNILRSLPRGAVLVMKKDVQLFALWDRQLAHGRRPDVFLVSQGLAGSPWYQRAWGRLRHAVTLGPLTTEEQWRSWLTANPSETLYISGDVEYARPAGVVDTPAGLLMRINAALPVSPAPVLLDEIYARRGAYHVDAYREFFTPDLIENYAQAYLAAGQFEAGRGRHDRACARFDDALRLQPLLPIAHSFDGYSRLQLGDLTAARAAYRRAAEGYGIMRGQAVQYRALAPVQDGLRAGQADTLLARGVCEERLGDDTAALESYRQAASAAPENARSYFNAAVVYWKRADWPRVIAQLENALRADPSFREAARYLTIARQNQRG